MGIAAFQKTDSQQLRITPLLLASSFRTSPREPAVSNCGGGIHGAWHPKDMRYYKPFGQIEAETSRKNLETSENYTKLLVQKLANPLHV